MSLETTQIIIAVIGIGITILGMVLSILGTILLMYFKDMKNSVMSMSESISELNVKMEKVVTDISWHREEIEKIDARINELEKKEV